MLTRVMLRLMLIGLLVIGVVAMLNTDANARSCGAWGCFTGSFIICTELTGTPHKASVVLFTLTNITVEAICRGPGINGQVVLGTASHPDIIIEATSETFEVDETGKVTACVEVEVDTPDQEICNNNWTKARGPDGTPSDAITYTDWVGQWFACVPETKNPNNDPDPCHDSVTGALTIAQEAFDTDMGFCTRTVERDENYVPIGGTCECTELNPD